MKSIIYVTTLIILLTQNTFAKVKLSKNIFRKVPYSSQYSESGALIRSVDFRSVNDLIPQLEKKFEKLLEGRELEDRNEAHITVVTPPEATTGFFPGSIGLDRAISNKELIEKYKSTIQETNFVPICVGQQSNKKGNIVFYLVIESKEIIKIRNEISEIVKTRNQKIPFKPTEGYYPHITIGFIGGDVHGVPKDRGTCVADIQLVD